MKRIQTFEYWILYGDLSKTVFESLYRFYQADFVLLVKLLSL